MADTLTMKTRIEWRHGAKVLKLDDTTYDELPVVDGVVEMVEKGNVHQFRVASIESMVVNLEVLPDVPDEVAPRFDTTLANRNERVAQRLEDDRSFKITPVKSKSAVLSRTARGNQTSTKVVSHKKK